MPIYTRTGDTGTTSLFGGKRVLKCEELVDVYGSIDELNSWIGLVVTEISKEHLKKLFLEIQSDLFTIGGNLAGGPARNASASVAGGETDLANLETRIPQMEVEIDAMEKELPALSHFILPGGTVTASRLHITRSIARRVERQVVALSKKQNVDPAIIKYLNRLSDLFFVLARYINNQAHVEEVVWKDSPRQKT
jgi:cob(I)alamin adenosyltransferase